MDRAATDFALVLEDGRCVGWLDGDQLSATRDDTDIGDLAEPLARWTEPQQTLREALEVALTSGTRVAIVQDEGRYLGVLPIERIGERLRDAS